MVIWYLKPIFASKTIKPNIISKFLYFFVIALFFSCNSTFSIIENHIDIVKTEKRITQNIEQQIHSINSYISRIDSKIKDDPKLEITDLSIHGNERRITTDVFKKNVIIRNNSIVRVKYNNHLHHNFIKSKIFYYLKNELVCIKIQEILPTKQNNNALYNRTIYIKNNKPIADTDKFSANHSTDELVNLGYENLKIEYSALD